MNTYNDNMQAMKEELSEVRYPLRKKIAAQLITEQAARKSRRDEMLSAIPLVHANYDEIAELVDSEYKVAMMEISSGNGKAREAWDYENECFSEHITAQASDSRLHSKAGLAEELIDTNDGIENKNESTYFDKELQETITVTDSNYSVWDTIAEQGALIVRMSKQWKSGFRADKWEAYSKLRATKKHNALLDLNNVEAKSRVTDSEMERKQAKRMARLQARMGNTNKVGYNAFA